MILTAVLAWYDEPPDELAACITGAASVADRIIALDGAYRRYPGGKPRSPASQVRAIRQAAGRTECLVLQPDRLWAGQVEKRNYLIAAGAVDSDWVMVVDSDHVVTGDHASVHAKLAGTSADVLDVNYRYPVNTARPLSQSAATYWAEGLAGTDVRTAHFFRALPGLRYESFHYWISAVKGGARIWLSTDSAANTYAQAPHEFFPGYSVEHRCLFRTRKKILGNRAFCNDRAYVVAMTGQEDDVPGLEPPVFDFESRIV